MQSTGNVRSGNVDRTGDGNGGRDALLYRGRRAGSREIAGQLLLHGGADGLIVSAWIIT